MRLERIFPRWFAGLSIVVVFLNLGTFTGYTQQKALRQNAFVLVKAVTGRVEYSMAGGPWQKATTNSVLVQGTSIRTQKESTADLFLPYSGTVLRLVPNSIVKVDSLERSVAYMENLTQTRLVLTQGSLV